MTSRDHVKSLSAEKEAHLVEGSEAAARSESYPVRMIQLTAKLCRRTYHTVGSKIQSVQVAEFNSGKVSQVVQSLIIIKKL